MDMRLAESLEKDDEAAVVFVRSISERDDDNLFVTENAFVRVIFSLTERCLVEEMLLVGPCGTARVQESIFDEDGTDEIDEEGDTEKDFDLRMNIVDTENNGVTE